MLIKKPSPAVLLGTAIFCLLVLLLSVSHTSGSLVAAPWNRGSDDYLPSNITEEISTTHGLDVSSRFVSDTTSEIGRASNETLGFSKIVVLGLKERTDKTDAINLAASLTGFQITEFEDGVNGDAIPEKAKPPGMHMKGGAMGCWRGHMNIMAKMIQHKTPSVFIMEDDADWDVRLLTQTPELAKGVRKLTNIPFNKHQSSPYGDDWDIIWPGHCGDRREHVPDNDDRTYIIYNDPTVPPRNHQQWEGSGLGAGGLKAYPNNTRIVHRAGAPICTFGYGVSLRGAKKIMYALAVRGYGDLPIDNAMAFMCADGFMDIKCYAIEPMLMYHHKPAGSVAKDSDINSHNADIIREKGWTANIVLSARLNLRQMIMGTTDWTFQW